MTNRPPKELVVFRHIDMHDGDKEQCWEWTRGLNSEGRPYITIDGRRYLAYRLVYSLFNGEIEDGKLVRHKCDNSKCCNPYHLILGTHEQNMDDMKQRERHGLPHHTVKAIRKLLTDGRTHQVIADLYGVSRETITAINNKRVYDHVED